MQVFESSRACDTNGRRRSRRRHGIRRSGLWPPAAAGLLALLVVGVATDRAQGTQEAEPVRETIVYSTIQPSNWDLYLFDGPGSKPRRLTTDPGLDYNGAFSPDGRWVVFTSERSGSPDLYVLDLHGSAPARPLIAGPAMEDAADISPRRRAAAVRQHAQRQRGRLRDAVPTAGPARRGRGRESDAPRRGGLQPGVLAGRHADSVLQQPRHRGRDEHRAGASADLPGQRAVRDAGGRERRAAPDAARELGRGAGVDARWTGGGLLLAARRGVAHLPHRHRRLRDRADISRGRGGAVSGLRPRRAAGVHGAARRPLDDSDRTAGRCRRARRRRHGARLLGTGGRPRLRAPAGARAGTAGAGLPLRERRAGGVSRSCAPCRSTCRIGKFP